MTRPIKKRIIRLLPAAAVMILIFVHSAMPADLSSAESGWLVDLIARLLPLAGSTDILTFLVRKAAHFTEYLLLGMSLKWGLGPDLKQKQDPIPEPNRLHEWLRAWQHAWLIGTAYAVTDEIHQYFVPGRSCEFRDICIDMIGVLAGVLIMRICTVIREKKSGT